jgi:hypothetical protein
MTTTTSWKPSPTPRENDDPPRRRLHVPLWALVALAAVLAAIAVPVALAAGSDGAAQQDRATDAERVVSVAAPVAVTLDDLCKQQTKLGDQLRTETNACAQAAKAREVITAQPAAVAVTGPSASEVQRMIGDALAGLPKPVTIEQVAAKAAEVYAATSASTPGLVAAAVTTYCADGKCQGKDGAAAPPPSDAQVLAQVTAMCADRKDNCRGVKGDQGFQGVSFQRQYFARDGSGVCFSFVEFYDPATNTTATASSRAGDAACVEAPPATSTSATPSGVLPGG